MKHRLIVLDALIAIALLGLVLVVIVATRPQQPAPTKHDSARDALVHLVGEYQADSLIETLCTVDLTPSQMVARVGGSEEIVHLAIESGCPERIDWVTP